jgi:hypothetical protein
MDSLPIALPSLRAMLRVGDCGRSLASEACTSRHSLREGDSESEAQFLRPTRLRQTLRLDQRPQWPLRHLFRCLRRGFVCRNHRFFEILHHWDIVGTETVLSRIPPPRRTYHPTVGAAVKNFERIIRAPSHRRNLRNLRLWRPALRAQLSYSFLATHGRLPAIRCPHTAPIIRRDGSCRWILPRIADV